MASGGGKITDALLAQPAERKALHARLQAEQEEFLASVDDIEEKISLHAQETLASSASSARKARALNNAKSLQQEANAARRKVEALRGRMEEIQDEIRDFEDLLGG
jgi:predicted  nucleic acid-binding Zn-ribbon protein